MTNGGAEKKVLVVDDSSIVRRVLSEELNKQPGIRVVGVAPDPYIAREKVLSLQPDVITLDIEMPRMDGLTFLRKLMKFHPTPTIIVSSVTPAGCDMAMDCLALGAVDVVCKPDVAYSIGDISEKIAEIVRGINPARVLERGRAQAAPVARISPSALKRTTNKIVAIGASTGGTDALARVLAPLPATSPGIVIVQHMPPGFTASFADRLDGLSELNVREARDGDAVLPGTALLAPGNLQMKLARDGARYIVRVGEGPRVCRHRPSVEVLFESAARFAGANAMGVILTGMGNDGAHGMLSMKSAGAFTVAQNEESCVVFGMPREAIEAGGVDKVVDLDQVPGLIAKFGVEASAEAA